MVEIGDWRLVEFIIIFIRFIVDLGNVMMRLLIFFSGVFCRGLCYYLFFFRFKEFRV